MPANAGASIGTVQFTGKDFGTGSNRHNLANRNIVADRLQECAPGFEPSGVLANSVQIGRGYKEHGFRINQRSVGLTD